MGGASDALYLQTLPLPHLHQAGSRVAEPHPNYTKRKRLSVNLYTNTPEIAMEVSGVSIRNAHRASPSRSTMGCSSRLLKKLLFFRIDLIIYNGV